jgi:hypothetical protein
MAGKFKTVGGVIAACAALLIMGVGPASAAEAGPAGDAPTTGTLTLNSTDPSFGATIYLSAGFSPMKWVPEESVECWQSGQMVYLDVQVNTDGTSPWTSSFTLWSQGWADAGAGAADCTASFYYYMWKGHTETSVVYLATISFTTT